MTHEERLREMAGWPPDVITLSPDNVRALSAGATALAITSEIAEGDPWEQRRARTPREVLFQCRFCGFMRVADDARIPEADRMAGHNDGQVMAPQCLYLRSVELHATR